MTWQALTDVEWQGHPLNRVQGGYRLVRFWIMFQVLLALILLGVLAIDHKILFDPAFPRAFDLGQWLFLCLGPPVVLWLLVRRSPLAPALYAAYFALVIVLALIAEQWAPFLTSAATYASFESGRGAIVFALFTIIDLAAMVYLFWSDRANVILRRRIRA